MNKELDFTTFFNEHSSIILMIDADTGKILDANPAALKFYQYTKEEITSLTIFDINQLEADEVKKLIPLASSKIEEHFYFPHKLKNGEIRYVEASTAKYNLNSEKEVLVSIYRDATEKKELEERIKRYLHFLNLAQNVTKTGCWSIDIKTGKAWWSKEAYNIFNIPRDKEVTLQDFFSFVHPEDREYVSDAWNKALNGEKYDIDHKIMVNDKVKYVNEKGEVLFNEKNEPIEAFGTVQDITERRMLEIKLEIDNKVINKIIELLPGYFWALDGKKNITKLNRNAIDKFNCKIGEKCFLSIWKGKFLNKEHKKLIEEKWIIPPDAKCEFCKADVALEKQEPIISEFEDNGTFYKVWWVPTGKDEHVICYLIDITEPKMREKELYDLSVTDPLTKIYNRRYTFQRIEYEIDLCKRTGRRFSLIMFDLDNFKHINDTYGHNLGDTVLKEVTRIVRERIRKIDVIGRWGGEEFLVMLPETSLLSAAFLADELRDKIATANIADLSVTASFGVTEYRNGDTVYTITERVDEVMYSAKKKGKNRVETR